MVNGQLPHRIKELHEQYGGIVRVAPNELSFTDPAAWRDIYPKNFVRPDEYKDQPPGKTAANLIACTEAEHARLRKILAPGFSEKYAMQQEPLVQMYVDKLTEKLLARIQTGGSTTVDVVEWINYIAFDIVGDLTWGSSFGCLDGLTYHPWIQTVGQFKTAVVVGATKFYPLLHSTLMAITPSSALKDVMEMWRITEQKVRRRLHDGSNLPVLMSTIVAAEGNPKSPMSPEEIEVNAMMIVAAGSESITTVLSGAINYLLRYPEKLQALSHEIRTTFASENDVTAASLKSAPYLNAVLNESMRLCPTIPDAMRRLVPAGGARVAGQFLPENTVVSIPPWASYRSDRNFTNPTEFAPERWLPSCEDSKYNADNKAAFNPFSLGPHNCPGQNLAWLEMRLVLARLLWRFDLSIPPGVDLPLWESQGIWWFWDKNPTLVRLSDIRR